MADGRFVSYLRVSTARQGQSGLGLEAQRASVAGYLNGGKWTLLRELVEVESGKRNDRPALAEAIRLCRVHRAILVIAKLDRLARNTAFIANLMEAGVKFVAVDMPEANDTMVGIMAVFAQHEAKAISDRTKAALAAAKARGVALGGLRGDASRMSGIAHKGSLAGAAARSANAAVYRSNVMPAIEEAKAQGASTLQAIANWLNTGDNPVPTRRGGQWSAVQVQRVLQAATR